MKRVRFLFLFFIILSLPFAGCNDDDDDAITIEEYTNPIKDNPVNTLKWLSDKKDETRLHLFNLYNEKQNPAPFEGFIKQYTFNDADYYEVGYYVSLLINCNSVVYDISGNKRISIIGGDGIGIEEGYEDFINFWKEATLKSLLWEYKYGYIDTGLYTYSQ